MKSMLNMFTWLLALVLIGFAGASPAVGLREW